MAIQGGKGSKVASLLMVGNLPGRTNFTFANSIKGARIKYGDLAISRVVILETNESMNSSDERSKVIRTILGPCEIVSVPCTDDFRVRAFETLAGELHQKDGRVVIVDITNGQRNQTFDLIVATSICRIDRVIITTVPRDSLEKPYWEIADDQYTITPIRPFSHDRALEAAAQFELIYYTDRVRDCVEMIRSLEGTAISKYADTIENSLTNAIMNYFLDTPEDLVNALKKLSELHEGIALRIDREVHGSSGNSRFADIVNRIQKDLSGPARISATQDDEVDEDRLAAVMLGDLFNFCREFRNYMNHPSHRRIRNTEVRFMIFTTFTLLEESAAVVSWLRKTKGTDVHSD